MGIRVTEIETVFGLTQEATHALAKKLLHKNDSRSRISANNLSSTLQEFGRDLSTKTMTEILGNEGWFKQIDDKNEFELSEKAIGIAWAITAPRMTFDEACEQILCLRDRVSSAPIHIDGTRVNNILLFGSALRDKNKDETIGDLDLIVEMGFDESLSNLDAPARDKLARKAWEPIIMNGDERLGFFTMHAVGHIVVSSGAEQTNSDKPFMLLKIWSNDALTTPSMTIAQQQAVDLLERKALETQQRAQAIHTMLNQDERKRNRPLSLYGVPYDKSPTV